VHPSFPQGDAGLALGNPSNFRLVRHTTEGGLIAFPERPWALDIAALFVIANGSNHVGDTIPEPGCCHIVVYPNPESLRHSITEALRHSRGCSRAHAAVLS
jgi:hypothetical protein